MSDEGVREFITQLVNDVIFREAFYNCGDKKTVGFKLVIDRDTAIFPTADDYISDVAGRYTLPIAFVDPLKKKKIKLPSKWDFLNDWNVNNNNVLDTQEITALSGLKEEDFMLIFPGRPPGSNLKKVYFTILVI